MPNQRKNAGERFVSPARLAGLPTDTPVLLALSGGADSRALLHLLANDAERYGYALTLAHVNHGIRGEEALRDRAFCQSLADRCGLELCILDADVPTLARAHGRGLEEEAREVRYAFFADLMRTRHIPLLATAHHADDNLETLLFRMARGTGLSGLCGILPVREFAGGMLTRPLLSLSRAEILAYCAENSLEYVTDSTNADTDYARNRIRGEIVPILETLFDGVQVRASATAAGLCEDEAFLSALAQKLLEDVRTEDGLRVAGLQNQPVPLVKRAVARYVAEVTGREPERVHVEALMRLLRGETPDAEVALPADFCAVCEFGLLRLPERSALDGKAAFELPFWVGETRELPFGVRVTVEKADACTKIHNLSTQSCIILYATSDIMEQGLIWRSRREGERLLCGGMHRKLRQLCQKADIPPRWRDRLPLLCDGEGIVWAPFVGIRDGLPTGGDAYRITVALPIPRTSDLPNIETTDQHGGNT